MPLGLVLNELVSNALKHAFPEARSGEIHVGLCANNDQPLTLTVADDGVGFPKNLDFRQTTSLGLQLVNTLVQQLNGAVELDRRRGREFEIRFAAA